VTTEEAHIMPDSIILLTDEEQLRSDARRLLESVIRRGRVDDVASEPDPLRNRGSADRHYLAMRFTIRLAAIMAAECAHPTRWDELGLAIANLQHSIEAKGTASKAMVRGREPMRQPGKVDVVPEEQARPIIDALSRREIAVVELIRQGHSNKEIARQLGIAPETVKSHVKRIFLKLGVERRAHAGCRAHALGLIGEGVPPNAPPFG
jgi:ATP/maltotriose-dependent transcriptional regulator MalT